MFKVVHYHIKTNKLLGEGRSVTFALVTDLHRQWWGERQALLMDTLEQEAPDAVLMSGDIFHHKEPFEGSRMFVREAVKRFPCYYVTGNHENKSGIVEEFKRFLRDSGVSVLDGECEVFETHGCRVNICGAEEYRLIGVEEMHRQLRRASEAADKNLFTVLLSHRPELIDAYLPYGFDLILCGHAHGGQWRIPGLINGFYAPGQGLFPKYAGGRYEFSDANYGRGTTMIVGRGLVNGGYHVPRLFNPPELPIITIDYSS